MLAARIRLGQKLLDERSTPTFTFTQSPGRVRLNISIDLDPTAFVLADDMDGTDDEVIKRNFRDAKIGVGLLSARNLETVQLEPADITDDSTTFTFSATVETKIPGTGGDVENFKTNDNKFRLQQENPSQQYVN
jgi:hypothetical protein